MVRRHQSTEVRQRQIIDAARKVIIKYGSEHVTVKRIAKEVGISETAIYRHFKSKKEVLSLLADYIGDVLVKDVTVASVGGRSALEILDSALRSHLSAIEQRRGVSFQVVAEIVSLGDKKLNKKMSENIDKYIGEITNLLSQAVRSGEIREDVDPGAAAIVIFGIILGLVNIWALSNYTFDPQEKYSILWNVFRAAIAKR